MGFDIIIGCLRGYVRAGFGPYRAERVIRLNTDPGSGKDVAADLHTLAGIVTSEGGKAAFEHIVDRRRGDRDFFKQWGPAFATKFITFTTKASSQIATTSIPDSIAAT